jgi:hypothetical protein
MRRHTVFLSERVEKLLARYRKSQEMIPSLSRAVNELLEKKLVEYLGEK